MLYGDNISKEVKDRELDFLKTQREKAEQQPAMPGMDGGMPEDQGEMGVLGEENEYNDSHEKAEISDLKQDMGIPELTQP